MTNSRDTSRRNKNSDRQRLAFFPCSLFLLSPAEISRKKPSTVDGKFSGKKPSTFDEGLFCFDGILVLEERVSRTAIAKRRAKIRIRKATHPANNMTNIFSCSNFNTFCVANQLGGVRIDRSAQNSYFSDDVTLGGVRIDRSAQNSYFSDDVTLAVAEAGKIVGEDVETDDQEKECVVCQGNEKRCAARSCGHRCLCIACANELLARSEKATCPICRGTAEGFLKIYD